jgi:hypothetical protein
MRDRKIVARCAPRQHRLTAGYCSVSDPSFGSKAAIEGEHKVANPDCVSTFENVASEDSFSVNVGSAALRSVLVTTGRANCLDPNQEVSYFPAVHFARLFVDEGISLSPASLCV